MIINSVRCFMDKFYFKEKKCEKICKVCNDKKDCKISVDILKDRAKIKINKPDESFIMIEAPGDLNTIFIPGSILGQFEGEYFIGPTNKIYNLERNINAANKAIANVTKKIKW